MTAAAETSTPPGLTVRLEFARVAGKTAVLRAEAAAPVKVLQPRHAGDAGWACLTSMGGGLVTGDRVSVSARVGAGACAALTTQASTKVYRGEASQRLEAAVAEDGLLVAAPDPIVCYKGARYRQRQTFELAAGADLAVIDWVTSGRAARGERWDFESYESRLTIERAGRPLLLDALRLDPEAGALRARLGRFEVLATAAITGPRLAAGALRLLEETARLPLSRRAPLVMTAGPLGDDGALLRLAAESVEEAAAALRRALGFVWTRLGDDPWSARY